MRQRERDRDEASHRAAVHVDTILAEVVEQRHEIIAPHVDRVSRLSRASWNLMGGPRPWWSLPARLF